MDNCEYYAVMNKFLAIPVVVAIGILASKCYACDCINNPKIPEPKIVFTGTAVARDVIKMTLPNGKIRIFFKYTFKVDEKISGSVERKMPVYTSTSDCTARITIGKLYMIVAKKYLEFGDFWFTDACFGNSRLPNGQWRATRTPTIPITHTTSVKAHSPRRRSKHLDIHQFEIASHVPSIWTSIWTSTNSRSHRTSGIRPPSGVGFFVI